MSVSVRRGVIGKATMLSVGDESDSEADAEAAYADEEVALDDDDDDDEKLLKRLERSAITLGEPTSTVAIVESCEIDETELTLKRSKIS